MIDVIDLIIKFLTLFFLAATSQMAFRNRFWGVMMISLGLWFTVFRTTILRATVLYAGVFNHTSPQLLRMIQSYLMGGPIVVFTDFLAMVGSFLAFILYTGDFKKK